MILLMEWLICITSVFKNRFCLNYLRLLRKISGFICSCDNVVHSWSKWALFLLMITTSHSVQSNFVSDYSLKPIQGTTSAPPMVLFAMSFDNELFKKAYSDYTDVNGDGVIDTGYIDSIDYYGYFESNWCYNYANGRFQPISAATGANSHFCTTSGASWSGNFLNWASMTRIDLIRKVLYGGKRSTDTSTLTVLERAEVPYEFHAFAKIYEGSDMNNLTPYTSSAITLCNLSESANGVPLLRVRTRADRSWAGVDRRRCDGSSDADFNVRVEACHATMDSSGCAQYSSARKPVGFIQRYHDLVQFGLFSGSFEKNTSGGVLRKNVSFATDEFDQSNGTFTGSSGMVATMDAFRIAEYDYSNQYYDCNGSGLINCRDWGNPIAEIYMDALRYLSGGSDPLDSYAVTSSSDLNLPTPEWNDPWTTANQCANAAIIILSTGQSSFDGDDYSDLSSRLRNRIIGFTDTVGSSEPDLTFPGNFLVGSNGGTGIAQCEPKRLTSLSQARGICPEVPHLQGSYFVAGMALGTNTHDSRSDLPGFQHIATYAIELAQTVPSLSFAVPDGAGDTNTVTLSPICQRASYMSGVLDETAYSPCTFLDANVTSASYDSSGALSGASIQILWADALGGDADTDIAATYTVTITDNNVNVRLHNPIFNGADSFRLGYSVSGVSGYSGMVLDADFNNHYSEVNGAHPEYDDGDNESALIIKTSTGPSLFCWMNNHCQLLTPDDVTKNYTPDPDNHALVLPKPLVLAAKYGGFVDLDNDNTPLHDVDRDGTPDDSREWDNRNNTTGHPGPDGIPDNYFFVNNPAHIEDSFSKLLKNITSKLSSASNVALVSNSVNGAGISAQALFKPKVTIDNVEISWVGFLDSLFVDSNGRIREDTNGNAQLDDYNTDFVVNIFFDTNSNQTLVQKFSSSDGGTTLVAQGDASGLDSLRPVWRAHEELMNVSDVISQRTYSDLSNTGRHILTWIDADADGVVDTGEEQAMVASTFDGDNAGFLGVSSNEVTTLVNYVRGQDQPGFRSRSVDYDNDDTLSVWRLGDIINSDPVPVSKPIGFYGSARSFDSSDPTFRAFVQQYEDRRQVIYVGSNGGLIHAFNAGFWDEGDQQFTLTNGTETSHPLGGELWAYAPMNLLPHLRWLTTPDYPHVYYMDGTPLIFDANIFSDDDDHPGGWGTVLVMGMGFGGGDIDVSIGTNTVTRRSAYVVMDITNPEVAPILLAEITHPSMGFTTVKPDVIKRRLPNSSGSYDTPDINEWYLVFGSGPRGTGVSGIRDALDNATSDQNLQVFIYDLVDQEFVTGFDPLDTGVSNSYSGDMLVVDWDNNNYDDAVYFGSVTTSPLGGSLLRINIADRSTSNWDVGTLLNVGRPITSKPLAVTDNEGDRWIFAGTGRELIRSDSRDTSEEYVFGVKEPEDSSGFTLGTVLLDDLVDTTDIVVRADGSFESSFSIRPGDTVNNFDDLKNAMSDEAGWINELDNDGTNPSNKSLNSPVGSQDLVFFTEYEPPVGQCQVDGHSFFRAQHYQTGTALPANVQKVLTTGTLTDTTTSVKRVSLGSGMAPAPIIRSTIGGGTGGGTQVLVRGEAGNLLKVDIEYEASDLGRQSWRQIFNIPR